MNAVDQRSRAAGFGARKRARIVAAAPKAYFPDPALIAKCQTIAAETGDRRHRAALISFWAVSFAVMLINALLPFFHEALWWPMTLAMPLLFISGGFYLIMRRCHFSGALVMTLGLFVWMVPALLLAIPEIWW